MWASGLRSATAAEAEGCTPTAREGVTLRFGSAVADSLRMPDLREEALVVDEQEEAYLRRAFHRFARPYAAGAALLLAGVWWLGGDAEAPEAMPGAAATPQAESPPVARADHGEAERRAAEQRAALGREIDALRQQIARLEQAREEALRKAPTAPASDVSFHTSQEWQALAARVNAITTRVQTLETSPVQPTRVERVVRTGAAPGDGSLDSLMDRVYNIEVRQEKEEAAIKATQKSLLDRVYALETRREEALAERVALDQSMMQRVKNVEDRLYAAEQRQSDSQPAAPAD